MTWEGIILELLATAASVFIGMRFNQVITYVGSCVILILVFQLWRAAIAERKLRVVKNVYGDGVVLLRRTMPIEGDHGPLDIRQWEKNWLADFDTYVKRIESLERYMPSSDWRKVTSVGQPTDQRFYDLIGEYTCPEQGAGTNILAGIVCFLEGYIN